MRDVENPMVVGNWHDKGYEPKRVECDICDDGIDRDVDYFAYEDYAICEDCAADFLARFGEHRKVGGK